MPRLDIPIAQRDLESEIQSFGLDLWQRIADEVPGLFNKSYWQGLILDWAMRDPSFKIDMFRLVDVLPSLASTDQISRHVRQLLQRDGRPLPAILSAAVKLASGGMASGLAARTIRSNVLGLAERFILGKDAAAAAVLAGLQPDRECDLEGQDHAAQAG
jgi:RHH-type proline utilization regulon transcriptional repressor/proline dehydrogenase/delta 1-pyrroline-5-carboxylate dehydrogenase